MTNAREAPRLSHLSRFNAGPRALTMTAPGSAISRRFFTVLHSQDGVVYTHAHTHHSPLPTHTNRRECLVKPSKSPVRGVLLDSDTVMRARAI